MLFTECYYRRAFYDKQTDEAKLRFLECIVIAIEEKTFREAFLDDDELFTASLEEDDDSDKK